MRTNNNSKENKNTMNLNSKDKEVNFDRVSIKNKMKDMVNNAISANIAKPETSNKPNMLELHSENLNRLNKLHEDGMKSIENKNNYKSLIHEEVLDITKLKNYYINLTNDNKRKYNQMLEEEKTFKAKSLLEQNDKSKQIEDLLKQTSGLREKSLMLESELQAKNVNTI